MCSEVTIFLSYPNPYSRQQQRFLDSVICQLKERGLAPQTVAVPKVHCIDPLVDIKKLVNSSAGLLSIAFRRLHVINGVLNPSSDNGRKEDVLANQWLSSPYSHIEPAMAYQAGLPVLVIRESGVMAHGILRNPVTSWSDLGPVDITQDPELFLNSEVWRRCFSNWEQSVHSIWKNKFE